MSLKLIVVFLWVSHQLVEGQATGLVQTLTDIQKQALIALGYDPDSPNAAFCVDLNQYQNVLGFTLPAMLGSNCVFPYRRVCPKILNGKITFHVCDGNRLCTGFCLRDYTVCADIRRVHGATPPTKYTETGSGFQVDNYRCGDSEVQRCFKLSTNFASNFVFECQCNTPDCGCAPVCCSTVERCGP